jgi:hypothetical protein
MYYIGINGESSQTTISSLIGGCGDFTIRVQSDLYVKVELS